MSCRDCLNYQPSEPTAHLVMKPHHVGAQKALVTGFRRAAQFYLEAFHPELNMDAMTQSDFFQTYLMCLEADERRLKEVS